jgi:cutinase
MGTVVGPPLANQLISDLGQVAVQGVNYPADVAGAASGSTNPKGAQGAMMMAQFTQMALQACPSTKVVLAGYSQGAEQVHGALMNLQAGQVSVSRIDASHKVY